MQVSRLPFGAPPAQQNLQRRSQTELINSINQKYAINKTLTEVQQRGLSNANVAVVLQK
jgi:hypothetical protein